MFSSRMAWHTRYVLAHMLLRNNYYLLYLRTEYNAVMSNLKYGQRNIVTEACSAIYDA